MTRWPRCPIRLDLCTRFKRASDRGTWVASLCKLEVTSAEMPSHLCKRYDWSNSSNQRAHVARIISTLVRVVLFASDRQCGETTLARRLRSVDSENYLDLENPTDLARLENTMLALSPR